MISIITGLHQICWHSKDHVSTLITELRAQYRAHNCSSVAVEIFYPEELLGSLADDVRNSIQASEDSDHEGQSMTLEFAAMEAIKALDIVSTLLDESYLSNLNFAKRRQVHSNRQLHIRNSRIKATIHPFS